MAITDESLITVRNRDCGSVSYVLDNNFYRGFNSGEIKKIPFSELKALSYKPGGRVLLNDCLVIEDKEALELLNMNVEPEYFYDKDKIREILFASNNIDAFADFLDFAPEGAIDIAKDIAIKEEIPDVRKRDMLSEKTGLNINNAIMVNKILNEENAEEPAKKQRRVQVEEPKNEAPTRRTAAPAANKYTVVSK